LMGTEELTKEINGLSDRELVGRAVGGDSSMFECLVNRHYMLVYRVAYKWCGIRENAEDITQEVFVKLARAIHGFKGGSAFRTWLYRITVNTAKDYLRSSARKVANEGAYIKERGLPLSMPYPTITPSAPRNSTRPLAASHRS
jgi:RNA polymerase sigma factor (sigma-70 family)